MPRAGACAAVAPRSRGAPASAKASAGLAGARRAKADRPDAGKNALRRSADEARSGWGHPKAGAPSCVRPGHPDASAETAPPRRGAPAGIFRPDADPLAALRRESEGLRRRTRAVTSRRRAGGRARRAGTARPRPSERGAASRSRKPGEAIRAASSACVIRVRLMTTGASVRLTCAVHTHPYSPRQRAQRGSELSPVSRLAESGRSAGQCRRGAEAAEYSAPTIRWPRTERRLGRNLWQLEARGFTVTLEAASLPRGVFFEQTRRLGGRRNRLRMLL
jgi:hypothetical protein